MELMSFMSALMPLVWQEKGLCSWSRGPFPVFLSTICLSPERSEWVCGEGLMWDPHAAAIVLVTPEFAPRTLESSVHYGN